MTGNKQADAKAGELTAPTVDITFLAAGLCIPTIGGNMVHGKLRRELKTVSYITQSLEWMELACFRGLGTDMETVNLPMTYLLLRSGRKATTAFTSIAASHRLRQKIQLMHQMRATGVELFRRRPDLYPDARCRRCGIQDEDELHIFACPRALDEVYEAVRACIESTLTFVSQILKKNKGALATLEYTVEQYTDINFWEGRQYFRVSREMGSRDSRLPSCTMLLQGLIPQRYIDDLEGTGASSASIRSHIVRQVGNLLQNIHKSVWLP